MKICQPHWAIMRGVVEDRSMGGLVARDGAEAVDRVEAKLRGGAQKEAFDPLMSLHWHFTTEAMRCGGLYLMGRDPSGANGGEYCPVCEFEKHSRDFNAREAIERIGDQMAAYCREQGLLPKVS